MARPELGAYVEDAEKPINYRHYLFLLRKNFYIVLTFFIITLTLATIYAAKIPDRYQAIAQLIVERPQSPGSGAETSYGFSPEATGWTEDYYKTQIEIMQSMAVMRQVVQALNLTSYYGIKSEDEAAERIKKMVRVDRVRGSRLFDVVVTDTDAEFAAKLANEVARGYIRVNFENRLYYTKELLGWLPEQGAEDEVISVKVPFGGVKQMTRDQLIESLPAIQTSETIRELKEKKAELEAELEYNLQRFREKHPVIIKLRSNMGFVLQSIEAEKKQILGRLKSEAEGQHQLGTARIIEEATPPRVPVPSKRMRMVVVISLAELALSLFIIFLLDYFDDTIRSVEDLERKGVVLPFLGPISLIKGKRGSAEEKRLPSFHAKKSEMAEAFRYLRVAINFSASPESLKNLVISSCIPHEGKSFVSHNLAVSLALDGNKTLLIDGDLRRPILHTVFHLDNSLGMSNYLTSDIDFQSVIKESFVENLSLVAAGPTSPNPGEILGSSRMRQFLDEAHKIYDRIIIDCPPLTGIGDGFVVGSMVGHVILVIAAGLTPADLILRTQSQLDKAHVKIIGTVLNMVDMEKERHGGYYKYYYHTYNRYYNQE